LLLAHAPLRIVCRPSVTVTVSDHDTNSDDVRDAARNEPNVHEQSPLQWAAVRATRME